MSGGQGNGAPVGQRAVKVLRQNRWLRCLLSLSCPVTVSSTDDAPEVVAAIAILADRAALLLSAGGAGLLDCFAAIPDPRSKRGSATGCPRSWGCAPRRCCRGA